MMKRSFSSKTLGTIFGGCLALGIFLSLAFSVVDITSKTDIPRENVANLRGQATPSAKSRSMPIDGSVTVTEERHAEQLAPILSATKEEILGATNTLLEVKAEDTKTEDAKVEDAKAEKQDDVKLSWDDLTWPSSKRSASFYDGWGPNDAEMNEMDEESPFNNRQDLLDNARADTDGLKSGFYDKDSFKKKDDNFSYDMDSFKKKDDNFSYDMDSFKKKDDNFSYDMDSFMKKDDNFSYDMDSFMKKDDNFSYDMDEYKEKEDLSYSWGETTELNKLFDGSYFF